VQLPGEVLARSDLLVSLAKAGSRSDPAGFRRALEAIVAEERAKQHHVLADRLAEYLTDPGSNGYVKASPGSEEAVSQYVHVVQPERELDELVLSTFVRTELDGLIEEQHRRELLRAHGLEPRHRVLLVGPPGNGKTTVAEAIARALFVPMYAVRYETVVASYLGETAGRLGKVFDWVRSRPSVLFFDEFDTIAKERGDVHETGEIKRVVSSLLLQIDDLPSHVVVVTATNHEELLDRAAWRRFEIRLELPPPTNREVLTWFDRIAGRIGDVSPKTRLRFAAAFEGTSFAELEMFEADALRQLVLHGTERSSDQIVTTLIVGWAAKRRIGA
jgi:ATPase family protein associated with various cellular activities (AAA)